MIAQSFDHERLDVDRLSIDYVARSFEEVQPL
jgi:selenocysteine lyase/cysteine desulfurase